VTRPDTSAYDRFKGVMRLPDSSRGSAAGRYILDGTKLSWHRDRIDAWLRGERIAPVTIDCSLTRRCTYRCVYCYGQLQANDEKK
jgi:hypothetical protein